MTRSSNAYYVWSREKSTDEEMFFWKPYGKGVTKFLDEAGQFNEEHVKYKLFKVLSTKRQVTYARKLSKYAFENFLIPINRVDILGVKKVVVIPY